MKIEFQNSIRLGFLCCLTDIKTALINPWRHIHIECNQWICIENQLGGFYFKLTLTGNEISITNHEVHGFSNSFQHKLKNLADWLAKCIFAYSWRTRFCIHKVFDRITKATMVHHLTPKESRHWWTNFFFKIHIADLFQNNIGQASLNPNNPFQRYWRFIISEHYEHARHTWPQPRKTSCSHCSFHGYFITYKKQTFYLK